MITLRGFENQCPVCGWYLNGSLLCNRPRRQCRRFTYNKEWNLYHFKSNHRNLSRRWKSQYALFQEVRSYANGHATYMEAILPWARKPNGASYRFDICIPALRLLVEYDGKQHKEFVPHFQKTKTNFYKQQIDDQVKDKLARNNNWKVIRISFDDPDGGLPVRRWIERNP